MLRSVGEHDVIRRACVAWTACGVSDSVHRSVGVSEAASTSHEVRFLRSAGVRVYE